MHSRGPTRLRHRVMARSWSRYRATPGPVHRPLAGGAPGSRSPGFQPLSRLSRDPVPRGASRSTLYDDVVDGTGFEPVTACLGSIALGTDSWQVRRAAHAGRLRLTDEGPDAVFAIAAIDELGRVQLEEPVAGDGDPLGENLSQDDLARRGRYEHRSMLSMQDVHDPATGPMRHRMAEQGHLGMRGRGIGFFGMHRAI